MRGILFISFLVMGIVIQSISGGLSLPCVTVFSSLYPLCLWFALAKSPRPGPHCTKDFKCGIRKVTESDSNKINRSLVTAKALLQADRSSCLAGPQCPSGLRQFLHSYHQQSREKNKMGTVKREGEEHVQRLAATMEEKCTSAQGLGGAAQAE